MKTETKPRDIDELTQDQLDDRTWVQFYNEDGKPLVKPFKCKNENLFRFAFVAFILKGYPATHYSIIRDVTECDEDDEANNINYHPLAE